MVQPAGVRLVTEAKLTTELAPILTKNTAQDGRIDVVEGDALRQRAALTTEDLNTITVIGTYGRESGGGATTALNYPVASRGVLTVSAMPGGGVAQSYYASFLNQTFTREKFGGVWSAWDSAAVSRGVLASGTNLNTLTGPEHVGTYSLLSTNTYPSAPAFTGTAVLEVQRGSGNSLSVVHRVTAGTALTWREAVDATAGTWSVWEQAETVSRAATTNAVQDGRLGALETAGYVPEWKANTAYLAGRRVIAPNGDVVSAKVNFTSGGFYSSVNWDASTQDGRFVVLETNTVPIWKANTVYAAGKRVISPGGDIVSSKVAFTSGATYLATDWNPSTDLAKIANTSGAVFRLSVAGLPQYLDTAGSLMWQLNPDGELSVGTVPWARLTGIPTTLAPVKCVRLENGAWVWDTVAGTHHVIPDETGQPVVRTTPWPVPNPTTPLLDW